MRTRLTFFTENQAFGGAEQYLAILVSRLPRDEFELTCIFTSEEVLETFLGRADCDGVSLIRFNMGNKPSAWHTPFHLSRVIKSFRPDIVHCNHIDAYCGSYAILASRLAGVPAVIGVFHTAANYPIGGAVDHVFARLVDSQLDAAIVVSKYGKEQVVKDRYLDSEQIRIIYNGVRYQDSNHRVHLTSPSSNSLRRDSTQIGTAGRLVYAKDFRSFILAASFVCNQCANVNFNIIGEGPDKGELIELTRKLELSERVRFTGWQKSIWPSLRGLDLFVLPSSMESCPYVILEAMASGLPVIATRVGGIPEIVEDGRTGILVPPKDPAALSDAILTLIRNPSSRTQMGLAGQQRVNARFSEERMVQETRGFYRDLLIPKYSFMSTAGGKTPMSTSPND